MRTSETGAVATVAAPSPAEGATAMVTTTENPAILSLARLRKCHPCKEQYDWAAAHFPEGIPLTVAAMTELSMQGVDYWWGVGVLLLASGRKAIARLALGEALAMVARELEDNGEKASAALAGELASLCPTGTFAQIATGIYRLRRLDDNHLLRQAEQLAWSPGDHEQLYRHWQQLNYEDSVSGKLVLQAALDLIAGRLRQEG